MSTNKDETHYTYKISHPNGKYYLGRRSCNGDPYKDSYKGSGKWVKSIKDKSILTKHIIEFYNSKEELKIAELKLIKKYYDGQVNCMNFLISSCGASSEDMSGTKNPMYGKTGENHPSFGLTGDKCPTYGQNNGMYGRKGKLHHLYGLTGDKCHNFGKKHSIETKKKMSNDRCGEKNSMYGKTQSLETKLLISKKNTGKNNLSGELSPNFGKKHSIETKEKMSKQKQGERHHKSSITNTIARLIKIRLAANISVANIVLEFNITRSVVNGIKYNNSWSHIII